MTTPWQRRRRGIAPSDGARPGEAAAQCLLPWALEHHAGTCPAPSPPQEASHGRRPVWPGLAHPAPAPPHACAAHGSPARAPRDAARLASCAGAQLTRPGLERWRDRAAMAGLERGLSTPPARLARPAVPPRRLLADLAQRGGQVEVLERPRHPRRLRGAPGNAAGMPQSFAGETAPQTWATRYGAAPPLTAAHLPTPRRGPRGKVASVRGLRGSPVSPGPASRGVDGQPGASPPPSGDVRSRPSPRGAPSPHGPPPSYRARVRTPGRGSWWPVSTVVQGAPRPPWFSRRCRWWPTRGVAGGAGCPWPGALGPGPGPGCGGLAGSLPDPDRASAPHPCTRPGPRRRMAAPGPSGPAEDPP
jgi:hypothetical protein